MGISRILGILLIFGGAALVVAGYFTSRSATDSIRTFLGMNLSKETLWFLIGGAAAFVSGLFVLMGGRD